MTAWNGNPKFPRSASIYRRGLASVVLALIACAFFENRVDLYRHLLQFLVVFLPIFALLNLRRILAKWRDLVLMLAATALCAFVVSLAGPALMQAFVMPFYNLDVDHRPRPLSNGTNEDGLYTDVSPADVAEEDFNIIFLGDSFTQGYLVNRRDNFVETTGRLLQARYPKKRIRVVNFGWVSSSPILQLRQLHSIGAHYKPDLVLQFFDMGDFHNDIKVHEMLKEQHGLTGSGEISIFYAMWVRFSLLFGVPNLFDWLKGNVALFDRSADGSLPEPQGVFFHTFQPLEESEPYFELSWNAILGIHEWAKQRGAEFALLVLPRYFQHNRNESPNDWQRSEIPDSDEYVFEAFKYFEKKARTAEFPIHSMLEAFRQTSEFPLCFRYDPHWNANGHRVAANEVVRFLIEEGYFD